MTKKKDKPMGVSAEQSVGVAESVGLMKRGSCNRCGEDDLLLHYNDLCDDCDFEFEMASEKDD